MESKMIKIEEIDDRIISAIRKVNKDSEAYKILASSIKKDGQRHPITIRFITDKEKAAAINNAKYGIIDGHHRFQIARDDCELAMMWGKLSALRWATGEEWDFLDL